MYFCACSYKQDTNDPFAMLRGDWVISGGPQAGKILRIPICHSTGLADSIIVK